MTPEQDAFCATCKMSAIRSENRGPPADERDIKPGQALHVDVQPNMAEQSLAKRDCFPNCVNIADAKSRKFRCIGTEGTTSQDAIQCISQWASQNKPSPEHTLKQHCHETHVDAGSQSISKEFELWCEEETVSLIVAAPHHQEMNGMCERMWQSARKIAFALCDEARLGWPFCHHALMHATRIMDHLPIKGCLRIKDDQQTQSCPEAVFKGTEQTKIGRFKVFGCPAVAKVF